MKRILALLLATAFSGGCIFVAHDDHHHNKRGKGHDGCGPAHHWENGRCVHNGKAKGHKK